MKPIIEALEKKLEELRAECALQRLVKRNAFGRRWALSGGRGASADKYWDDRQAAAQAEATAALEAADRALVDFIAESRVIMGPDWIGSDHGRLCWEPYLGGYPIDQHYCCKPEGHTDHHADEIPTQRWACNSPRGQWPQGVTGDREWHELIEGSKTENRLGPTRPGEVR
jgi:hypothetical protein